MALIDSTTSKILRRYTPDELKTQANLMRGYNLVALCAAGSGHAGGTLSIMDITAALYLDVADHDPKNPNWPERDRIFWSAGHKAPALYVGLAFAGFCDREDVVTLRKLYSPFQGHPHWLKLPGVEASTGSLGQGLSVAVGSALACRWMVATTRSFASWATASSRKAASGKLPWKQPITSSTTSSPSSIVNRLQIDGAVSDVMNVAPLAEKYQRFRVAGDRHRRPRHGAGGQRPRTGTS